MDLTQFLTALAQKKGSFDGIDVGSLLALVVLEAHASLPETEREAAITAHLGLMDQQLALAQAPEDLRVVIAGVRDQVLDWYARGRVQLDAD